MQSQTHQNSTCVSEPSRVAAGSPNLRYFRGRGRGLSIVELLVSLVICALLLTAITVALNASFHAYATAAESASTQSASRLVMQRTLAIIRGGTLHDAYDPDDATVVLQPPTAPPVQSVGIQVVSTNNEIIRIWWKANAVYSDADLGDLVYSIDGSAAQPMLEQVRVQRTAGGDPYIFSISSRSSDDGLLLHRATMDLTVEPGADATLALESARGSSTAVRLVGSTMPRRHLE